MWGPGYGSTVGRSPAPGDLVVWNGTPGHVAVVVDATPQSVRVMQQNKLPVVQDLGWDVASSYFSPSTPECWVHAESAPPATAPSGPNCGCFDGPGDYCGLSIVDHAWWNACTPNVNGGAINYDTLYTCSGGTFTPQTTCSSGCVTRYMQPATGACGG